MATASSNVSARARGDLETIMKTISAWDYTNQIESDENNFIALSLSLIQSQQQHSEEDMSFYCCNENHKQKIGFKTEILKQVHVARYHGCHVNDCSYYNEFDEELSKHFQQAHRPASLTECELCDVIYEDDEKIKHYMSHHVQCNACCQWWADHQSLYEHEIECSNAVNKDSVPRDEQIPFVSQTQHCTSLLVDKSDTVYNFSQALKKLVIHAKLTETEKKEINLSIDCHASENLILKARERRGDNKRRQNDSLFDCPDFSHKNKPNVEKLSSFLGAIKQSDIFCAIVEESSKKALDNYFQIEKILSRLDSVITLCNLNEKHGCVLLEEFLSRNVADAIKAYCRNEVINLGFAKCIQTLEYLYCPLDLQFIEQKLMGTRKDKSQTMFQFANHCRKILSLCSRRLPSDEQQQYIEGHLTHLIKNNLKKSILDEVEKKESIFSPFNSQELLDLVLADIHSKGNYQDHFESFGKVNYVDQWNFGCQDDISDKDYLLHPEYGDSDSPEEEESWSSESESDHVYKVDLKPKNQWRRDILCQYDQKYSKGIHCYFCLGPHTANLCNQGYSGPFSDELCIKDGKPCGFHEKIDCLAKFSDLPREPTPVQLYTPNMMPDDSDASDGWTPGPPWL